MILGASYAYVLFRASGMISDGSEELMLFLSPGLVGGFILPVLGAIPDGAIVLFSGMGPIDTVQEQLSVGVGTLAGSSIMLLTLPWAACAFLGRVDLAKDGLSANFKKGLTRKWSQGWASMLTNTGVQTSGVLAPSARVMVYTCLPYLIIGIPALIIGGFDGDKASVEDTASREKWWSLVGLVFALLGFAGYSYYQVTSASQIQRQEEVMMNARRSALARSLIDIPMMAEIEKNIAASAPDSSALLTKQKSVVRERALHIFKKYDVNNDGKLDSTEVSAMLKGMNLVTKGSNLEILQTLAGSDKLLDQDEFFSLVEHAINHGPVDAHVLASVKVNNSEHEDDEEEDDDDEKEEEPETRTTWQIQKSAYSTLLVGIFLITVFSDPMVDVLSEVGKRINVPAFYIAFIVAPVISNASEVISGVIQASKKKQKNLDVSYVRRLSLACALAIQSAPQLLTALAPPLLKTQFVGAATMNNTFVLSIFLLLVFARSLAWKYTAEVFVILLVQFGIFALVSTDRNGVTPLWKGAVAGLLFPLSIIIVYCLTNIANWD